MTSVGTGSSLALVFVFIERQQIELSDGKARGDGVAKAGIVLGFLGVAVTAAFVVTAVYDEYRVLRGD